MLAGHRGQAYDRVLVDADQACRLPDPTVLLQMLEDGDGFVLGEFAVEQRRAFAFGKTLLTGAASQHAALLRAIAKADAQVIQSSAAVVLAVAILAAIDFQVI